MAYAINIYKALFRHIHMVLGVLLIVMTIGACTNSSNNRITTSDGMLAYLDLDQIGEKALRITLRPRSLKTLPVHPAFSESIRTTKGIRLKHINGEKRLDLGPFRIYVTNDPISVSVYNQDEKLLQELEFGKRDSVFFKLGNSPILGLGEGGPRQSSRSSDEDTKVEFDRRGRYFKMQPRWQNGIFGSRNPVPLMIGTEGWAMYFAAPWVEIDLSDTLRAVAIPWIPEDSQNIVQTRENQELSLGKGKPPFGETIHGLSDIIVFDSNDPEVFFKDLSVISGQAVLPPKWALGYMQSHRTLEDEDQMIQIVDTFREKQIPLDAVIYLGTEFCPRGWNTTQPSFDFNPDVFYRQPREVLDDLNKRNVRTVLHMIPFDRDRLPTLHGNIPPIPEEALDSGHILHYWKKHTPLMMAGVDAFWPDEGDWFNLHERLKRHQMYYQGPLSVLPNTRPWTLHRNGYLGIARWGGWVWSGDTYSSWKALETQIAVGLNHSLSLSPFWGSDIGGFYPNPGYTGELFVRWLQFSAFCPSFRSHGRTWWTHLPWGWGLSEMGPKEINRTNDNSDEELSFRRNPLQSELNNHTIEPVAKKYIELRYQFLSYNYSMAWQAREIGLPMMRALWVHYPNDPSLHSIYDEYLWGSDLLIAPVYKEKATQRKVVLPPGQWYDWWTSEKHDGGRSIIRDVDLGTMPIYVRAGAIIPLDPMRQYTDEDVDEATEIRIYPGANGNFKMYDDDGISLEYLEGKGTITQFDWDEKRHILTLTPDCRSVDCDLPVDKRFKVTLMPGTESKEVRYIGEKIRIVF